MRVTTKLFLSFFMTIVLTVFFYSLLFEQSLASSYLTVNAIGLEESAGSSAYLLKVAVFSAAALTFLLFLTNVIKQSILKPVKNLKNKISESSFRGLSERNDEFGELSREINKSIKKNTGDYKNFLDSVNDLVQSVNSKGFFIYVNKKWIETLGYSLDEAKRMHFSQILRKDQIPHCMKVFKEIPSKGEFNGVRTYFVTKGKKEVPVEGSINAKVIDGRLVETRGVFRDISEREKIENENKRIQEMMIGREIKMSELKKEITKLKKELKKK